jgi:DMSO/TMAO reductase YedYZ molybdopterin-dependent catalytic subunit
MTNQSARREILKGGLAAAALSTLPEWVLPALAQGETLVPFTDLPANANFAPAADRRVVDIRRIDGPFTPADQFYTIQHYNQPEIDPATYRLNISGLVRRPVSLSLADLRAMHPTDLVAGFECSGNRRPLQGLCGNGRWTGVPLRDVLSHAGVANEAREFVFFGADRAQEDVDFRGQTFKVEQQFGRSLPREKALSPEPFLTYALNGQPLTKFQGAPLRLLVPGWYGVSNVKWLSQIHVQADQYLGKFQARWYRTLKGEMIDGEMKWTETSISRMKLKSFIARVTKEGSGYKVLGVVLNDGTPLKSVEVRVDDGPWQPAAIDAATSGKYSWKLFTYAWSGAAAGEHTIVSRATDVTGAVQPTSEALESKKTFLEDNSQFPRKVKIG